MDYIIKLGADVNVRHEFGYSVLGLAKLIQNEDVIILSADTVVFLNGEILGKPQNEKQASLMLKQLSDKTHSVTTGFCIKCGEKEILDTDTTFVTFNDLSNELINEYIASGLYKGKAGAYGIEEPTGENFTRFDEIEFGIIPGVSFDKQGNRLGRGKGYYDKLLPHLNSYNIGICYRFQAQKEIPAESFDRRMDEVWTEEGRWC